MNLQDTIPVLKGTAILRAYEGDIEWIACDLDNVETQHSIGSDGIVRVVPKCGPYRVAGGGNGQIQVPKQAIIKTLREDNIITTAGKGLLLDRLFALASAVAVTSIGVGASATAAVIGDTQLGTTPTIIAQDATFPSRSSLVVTSQGTFGTGSANISWNECGLFNGTVNGTSVMLDRIAPIGPFTKTSAVSIVLQITVTQS